MIEAAIFDMDGLLVDSEPQWRYVEQEVFRTVGLELTDEQCKRTTGMPIEAVVRYWYERHPWTARSQADVATEIHRKAHERIGLHAGPMPGVPQILEFFEERGVLMAVASASPMDLIETVLDRLSIRPFFRIYHSATLEKRNKPHPDVYLGTAAKLGVSTDSCLAFEDSGSGLMSAHSAGMKTVAVPADYEFKDPKFSIASLKIASLAEFNESVLSRLFQP